MELEFGKDRRVDGLGDLRVLPDELLCAITTYLTPRDVARLACVSSVMYILCNEEPLWMSLCINHMNRQLEYKGSWKKTTFHQLDLLDKIEEPDKKPLTFYGFNSLFLYRRMYRCYTTLNSFSFDDGNVERQKDLSLEEFHEHYDGVKPVLIGGLADAWPAKNTWTTDQLMVKYGETPFRISQRSPKKIVMKFKDYVSYTQIQHDEDPLYIFDDKFGEVAPDLLKDYNVPNLFQEDFFDVVDMEQRPPFRWIIIGPERSGASWHIDPALTSAWNTLLCGRKRWALYPPGRVPLGVTVHVNEEDGDVNIDAPTSLQWWLDFYPLLADEDKPIECTQLPGETIYVPSGWWHCVLNLETTIAVTQNFVNSKNFEFACLDMAPGYRHKGVCRAGLLALDEADFEDVRKKMSCLENSTSNSDLTRKGKRVRSCLTVEDANGGNDDGSKYDDLENMNFRYDIGFLSMFLDKEMDHYSSVWSSGNCIGQREMRDWLRKLWVGKPGLRELLWKGACISINADRWFERLEEICAFHGLPLPTDDEKLPVGTGSNPVYLIADNVVKIFVEDGLEASMYNLGTELEFYNLLHKGNSPLKNHIPGVLASGILFLENGLFKVMAWDGRGIPEPIAACNLVPENQEELDYPFGIWRKKQFEYTRAGLPLHESESSGGSSKVWPYIVTRRCRGKVYAEVRDTLSWEDTRNLASFLGEQMRNLHLVPCPPLNELTLLNSQQITELPHSNGFAGDVASKISIPAELQIFNRTMDRKKKDVKSRLTKWGDPIPAKLIEKVDQYIPDDFLKFFYVNEDELEVCKSCTWIHSDVMDDNVHMEPSDVASSTNVNVSDSGLVDSASLDCSANDLKNSWCPNHILDFSDLSVGDPIIDLIPIHVDIFRGNSQLLKQFLESYKLPLGRRKTLKESVENNKYGRLSYLVMCHCILHDDNVLGAIFSLWKELKTAKSWEEVEEAVWGDLNSYTGLS